MPPENKNSDMFCESQWVDALIADSNVELSAFCGSTPLFPMKTVVDL